MEAARSFATNNRGTIINVIYVIAFVVAVYYLYKFLIQGSELEVSVLDTEAPANVPQALPFPSNNEDVRVKQGGEYTISFWMYITSWDYRSGLPKSVLQIVDSSLSDSSLFTSILYPNEAKMMIRVHTDSTKSEDTDYTKNSNYENLMSGQQGAQMFAPSITSPMCDIQDIDLQRWINITVTVNGRIVDVYYDGKLNRSCVLPSIPAAPATGKQSVVIGQKGGYGGKISGVQFMAYPLTPDRIYAIYQAGPASAGGFLGYMADKLGIKINYSGSKKSASS
jgi:hypothetical protein